MFYPWTSRDFHFTRTATIASQVRFWSARSCAINRAGEVTNFLTGIEGLRRGCWSGVQRPLIRGGCDISFLFPRGSRCAYRDAESLICFLSRRQLTTIRKQFSRDDQGKRGRKHVTRLKLSFLQSSRKLSCATHNFFDNNTRAMPGYGSAGRFSVASSFHSRFLTLRHCNRCAETVR